MFIILRREYSNSNLKYFCLGGGVTIKTNTKCLLFVNKKKILKAFFFLEMCVTSRGSRTACKSGDHQSKFEIEPLVEIRETLNFALPQIFHPQI